MTRVLPVLERRTERTVSSDSSIRFVKLWTIVSFFKEIRTCYILLYLRSCLSLCLLTKYMRLMKNLIALSRVVNIVINHGFDGVLRSSTRPPFLRLVLLSLLCFSMYTTSIYNHPL